VPTSLGAHNPRVDFARSLLAKKGRREHGRFSLEGATLLREALEAGVRVESVFATQTALDETPLLREIESPGLPVYAIDEKTMRRISDVETPSGIVAVAPIALERAADLLSDDGVVLVLADVNDPGNAGTLLRSAEAFGVTRVIFGEAGAEPFLPKVVRSAMGAVFRLRLAVTQTARLKAAMDGWEAIGLEAGGTPLGALQWPSRTLLVVGNERHGLGEWRSLCVRSAAIPMSGQAESLNAAVAGSIALYEATKGT
jgi:TrmH family RNA methyltransferase